MTLTERAKSVIRAIKKLAGQDPRLSVNEIRVIVALERAIARLVLHDELSQHLVFKGGFVLLKVFESARFTRDADAIATSISEAHLKALMHEALTIELDDGFWFGDIQVKDLETQGLYGGYRFDCAFQIGSPDLDKIHKLSRIHIDVGVSDKISDNSRQHKMLSILTGVEPISWKVYPAEYIVAEKLHAFYDRASGNSRAKDIFDLLMLLPLCADAPKLKSAIASTFANRQTNLPVSFGGQAAEFDLTTLRLAWPSVKILQNKGDFETHWNKLMEMLAILDNKFKIAE